MSCRPADSQGFLWPGMRAGRSASCPWCWLPDLLGLGGSSVLHARVSWHRLQEENLHRPANHIPVLASLVMPQVPSPRVDQLIPTWEYPKGHPNPAWQFPKGYPCFRPFLAQTVRVGSNHRRQLCWFICEALGPCSASESTHCCRSPALSMAEMTLLLQCGKQRLISSCAEVPLICLRCLGKAQRDFLTPSSPLSGLMGVSQGPASHCRFGGCSKVAFNEAHPGLVSVCVSPHPSAPRWPGLVPAHCLLAFPAGAKLTALGKPVMRM